MCVCVCVCLSVRVFLGHLESDWDTLWYKDRQCKTTKSNFRFKYTPWKKYEKYTFDVSLLEKSTKS